MALSVGNNNVAGMSVGTDEVASAYWGEDQVWSSAPAANMCTVANLGAQDPSTVTFTDTGSINYDFEEVTINGNVFVKIPTFYRKVETVVDNQITSFTLADAKVDNNYHPYPCFLKPNGDLMDYVLIGKYAFSSTSEANSVNATPASLSISSARSLATALGTGYQLYDWQFQKLFVDLALCKSKKVDFNDYTGTSDYLNINHLSLKFWIDGIGNNSGIIRSCYDSTKYINNPGSSAIDYIEVGYQWCTQEGWCVKLGYDINNPFVNYTTNIGNSQSTYYCDYYSYKSGNYPLISNVGGASNGNGLWNAEVRYNWTASYYARLCYRPV